MRATRRFTAMPGAGAASAVLALPGLAAPAAADDAHTTVGGFRPAAIDWHPCPQRPDDTSVTCATMQLPIDWSDPGGPTFGLAVAKQEATDPAADEGPLLVNPGGPGISGVDFTLDAENYSSANIRQHFDIIGFDPRGTGRSDPVQCSAALLAQRPFPVPASQADYDALLAYNARLGADCRANTGAMSDHVDALSNDRDMDAIRAALGAPKISYYGESYGTLMGHEYAELFPDRVRAMVTDSNMDHSIGTQPFLVSAAAAMEDSFHQFTAWCDRSTSCALHGQDVAAIRDGLMHRADAGTLTDPSTGRNLTWMALEQKALTPLLVPNWALVADTIAALDAGAAPTPSGSTQPSTSGLAPNPAAVFCQDWSLPVAGYQQLRQYLAQSTAVAPHVRISAETWNVTTSCLGWPARVNNPQHPLRAHTTTPVLELNSVHDPATPYTWAVNDAVQLGSSGRLLTDRGWGHIAYRHSACTTDAVDSYLIDLTLRAPGTACPATLPAAQTGASAPSTAPHSG